MDTLHHNIGRLCLDRGGAIYIVKDIQSLPWSVSKYVLQNVKTGKEIMIYPETMSNVNFVTWLTPPRQNPVAQPPERQNDDASKV
jgi:hypothetical protein